MTDAAIKAHYHDYKRVLGRKVLQIVLEVPLEQEGEVHAKIGYPSPDGSTWVGIARLVQEPSAKPEKERRQWSDMPRSQQAGIKCNDPDFRLFLEEKGLILARESVDAAIKGFCGIASKTELDDEAKDHAQSRWDNLYSNFQLWLAGSRAAA